MSIGPVEYLTIAFPGNRFDGRIAPAIAELVGTGTVRIIDLVFLIKDEDGAVAVLEYDDLEGEATVYAELDGEASEIINDEDIALAAEALAPGSSAIFLLWEDLWATRLAEAVRAADGVILNGGRIPHEAVLAALEHAEA